MRYLDLETGALAPSLAVQLEAQKLTAEPKKVAHWQQDINAINRLRIRGLVAPTVAHAAMKRVVKQIAKGVKA